MSLRPDGEDLRVIFGRKAYRVPQDAVLRYYDRPLNIREKDLDLTTNPEDSVTPNWGACSSARTGRPQDFNLSRSGHCAPGNTGREASVCVVLLLQALAVVGVGGDLQRARRLHPVSHSRTRVQRCMTVWGEDETMDASMRFTATNDNASRSTRCSMAGRTTRTGTLRG